MLRFILSCHFRYNLEHHTRPLVRLKKQTFFHELRKLRHNRGKHNNYILRFFLQSSSTPVCTYEVWKVDNIAIK